jgi:proline dehydrogenase
MKIGLPIKSLIKATIFKHFAAAKPLQECDKTIKNLAMAGWAPS